jgi:hypothetical protein
MYDFRIPIDMAILFNQISITNSINYMQSFGCVSPNYMAQQFDINERMRAILIDWLIEVYSIFFQKC